VPAPTRTVRPVDAVEIQEQAARLLTRVRGELGYQEPKRNPFRFTARPIATPPRTRPLAVTVTALPVATPVFPFTLQGMAIDRVDDQSQRTAIVASASDVLLLKLGDSLGSFIVTRLDEAEVELTGADGTVRTLTLTP
jgi:hypothetical protein